MVMATTPSATFCPRRAWVSSIDEVLLQIRMRRLQVDTKKRLKVLQEEREYWQRWRRAQKLKKEKQYVETRKEKQRSRRREDEELSRRRWEQRRRDESERLLAAKQHQQKLLRHEREEDQKRCRMRSMDRSRIEGIYNTHSHPLTFS